MTLQEKSQLKDIDEAVKILRRGGIVIFPTDTVYGISCRYDQPWAIDRIKNIKKSTQIFPILISNINQAHRMAVMSPTAIHLANKFWPGALTIILRSKTRHDKIGLRMPDSEIARSIIEKLGLPIIGTSANFHTQAAVARYEDLDPKLIKLADYVISGECEKKMESTVVDATISPVKILREGVVKIR